MLIILLALSVVCPINEAASIKHQCDAARECLIRDCIYEIKEGGPQKMDLACVYAYDALRRLDKICKYASEQTGPTK